MQSGTPNEFINCVRIRKHSAKRHPVDWRDGVIGLLWLLLWTTNRRRVKPDFELSDRGGADHMFPTLAEITAGFTDSDITKQLGDAFFDDMKYAVERHFDEWRARPWHHKLFDDAAFMARREL